MAIGALASEAGIAVCLQLGNPPLSFGAMDLRALFLFTHLLGVILWLGVTFTLSFITAKAARTDEPRIVAFAYRSAQRLNKTVGTGGVVLTLAGGIGLTIVMRYPFFRPFPHHWLFQMQLLGFVAAALALVYQLPNGERLAKSAEAWARSGERPDGFRASRQRSAIVGSLIGFILIVLVGLGSFRLP